MTTIYHSYITTKGQEYSVLTGPFKDKYAHFREKYLGVSRLCEWIHFKYNLLVGSGWIFPMDKSWEIKQTLMVENIDYTEQTFDKNIRIQRRKQQRREYARRYRAKKKLQSTGTAGNLGANMKRAKTNRPYPKYEEMIGRSIIALRNHKGSSQPAILNYILANFPVPEGTLKIQLRLALKRGCNNGKLIKNGGSYRVSPTLRAAIKKPV